MRNKMVLAGLVFLLTALVFFSYQQKNADLSVDTPTSGASQGPSPDTAQANTKAPVQAKESAAEQRDFFLGGISFNDIKGRAESGDAIAQRHLSEIYEDCMFYSFNPEKHFLGMDQLSNLKPESKPYLQKIKVQMREFCSTVDNGQAIPVEAYKLWRERSAQAGDLTSKIRIRSHPDNTPSATELQLFFEEVSQTGDPSAMFEFGSLAASNEEWTGVKGNEALYGQYAEYAWQIAACRRGLNCSGDSRLMRNLCIGTMMCQHNNYEDFLFTEMVPQGARKEIEKRVLIINKDFIQAQLS